MGASTNQTIQYTGNSFTITSPTGAEPGGGIPASFPSIYIGANGDTQRGVFSTTGDDNLPRQISAINTLNSTFRFNTANGDYNATYDIWLSTGAPTSAYSDAISGFVMIWLYKPGNRNPIGNAPIRTNVTIPGAPGTWNVYAGPRNSGTVTTRPVISYVATATITNFSNVNIKPFLTDAATVPGNGFTQVSTAWYVTDVFGGFEIWNGAGTMNLALQEFSATVQ
jgi:hypothetical protein